MLDAVGDILPLAVGVALSPLPIIAVVLMLVGRRARANGPLFVVGWLVGLGIVGTIVLAIAGPTDATRTATRDVGRRAAARARRAGAADRGEAVAQPPARGRHPSMPKWMA